MVLMALFATTVLTVRGASQGQAPAGQSVADKAKAFVTLLAAGEFEKAEAGFDTTMKSALPLAKLQAAWATVVQQAGPFKRQVGARTEERGPYHVGIVTCEFGGTNVDVSVVYDAAGLVAGLNMRPSASAAPYSPPPYASPSSYSEADVTVGSAPWALPGTLTVPVGNGPFPAVVLVHGSGPNDRNESIAANRPFEDLALGLATRGVAVLRYDKRTKVYASRLANVATFTVAEETVDDAHAAVELLTHQPRIDPKRIFVLGHSLGGMLVPRIAAAAPEADGFIVMAGAARSIDQAVLEQIQYLANADGTITPAEQTQIDDARKLTETVRGLTAADASNPKLIFGAPASYWLDLRGYDPPQAARAMTRPLLVLQGERDYQVTMDEFARWKAALDGRANVTFHSYPGLNHLFIAGTGPSLPIEYNTPGHVAATVVDDIAAWVRRTAPVSWAPWPTTSTGWPPNWTR